MALQKRQIVLCSLSTNNDGVGPSSDSFLGRSRRVSTSRQEQDSNKESYDSTLDEGFIDREEAFFQHFLFAPDEPAHTYKSEHVHSDEEEKAEEVEYDTHTVELHSDTSRGRVRKRKRRSHHEDDSDDDEAWLPEKMYNYKKKKLKTKNNGCRDLRIVGSKYQTKRSQPRNVSPSKQIVNFSSQNNIGKEDHNSANKSIPLPRFLSPNRGSTSTSQVYSIGNKKKNLGSNNKESPDYECTLQSLCLKVDSEKQDTDAQQNSVAGRKLPTSLSNRVDRLELAVRPNLCVIHMWGQDPPALCMLLQRFGVFPQSRTCPRCQHKMKLEENPDLLDGLMWICKTEYRHINTKTGKFTSSQCKKRCNFRKGSIFEKCKLPLCSMLKIVHLFLENITLENIANELRINEEIVKKWTTTFQDAMISHLHDESIGIGLSTIGGPGKTVEIGEGRISSNKFLRRQEIKHRHIVCGMEHDSGKFFIIPIKDLSNKTINHVLNQWIRPGATIVHSGKEIYDYLSQSGLYECVDRSEISDNQEYKDDVFLNVQMELPLFSQYSGNIAGCLATIIFLKNCKSKKKIPFWEFLRLVVNVSIS